MIGAPSGPLRLAADYLADAPPVDDPDLRQLTRKWLESRNIPIAERLRKPMEGLWTDAYFVGAVSARTMLSHHGLVVKADEPATVTLGADWAHWTPGDWEAARELLGVEGLGDGLAALLEHGGIVLKGIEAYKLDQLAAILAAGVSRGDAPAKIAQAIRSLVDDPKWAYRVALTETTRAVSSATLARYHRNGVDAKEWMTAGDQHVCVPCNVNEDTGAIPLESVFPDGNDAPPSHPLCRCSIAPAWLSADEAAAQGVNIPLLPGDVDRVGELAAGLHQQVEDVFAPEVHGRFNELMGQFGQAASRAAPGADTPAQIASAQAVQIREVLANAKTVTDIAAAFEAEADVITGTRITADFGPDASALTAREHAEGILRALERFPQASLDSLSWTSREDAFAWGGNRGIEFSTQYTTTAGRAKYLRSLAKGVDGWADDYDWRSSWSFRGSANPAATAVHEFGHILELDTIGESLAPRVEALVDEIADRLGLSPVQVIRRQVSTYATTNTTELIAEAFGDAILNGEAASELSRGIMDLIVQEYEKAGGVHFSEADLVQGGARVAKLAANPLSKLKVAELRQLAAERGITVPAGARKADLVRLLEGEKTPAAVRDTRTLTQLKTAAKAQGVPVPLGYGKPELAALLDESEPLATRIARARQVVIDQHRAVADSLTDVAELLANGASDRALAARATGLVARQQMDAAVAKLVDPLVKAMQSGDQVAIRREVAALQRKAGLRPVGAEVGQLVRFDRKLYQSIGGDIPAGAQVRILRPGFEVTVNGEKVTLSRGVVQALSRDEVKAIEQKALREAARARNALIESSQGTARLLAEVDELIGKGASKAVIRQRLDPALIEAGQAFAGADPAALTALRAALESGDPAKLKSAVQRMSTRAKIKPIAKAGAKVKYDPATMEPFAGDIPAGAQVTVVRRGSSVTLPDGTTLQLEKARVQPVPTKAAPARLTGRPPATPVPIHELIDASDAKIEAALRDVYEGKFGPYTTKVEVSVTRAGTRTSKTGRVTQIDPSIHVSGKIYDSAGHEIGYFGRSIGPTTLHYADGMIRREVWAEHKIVQLDPAAQGKGFGGAFNQRSIEWYRESGIHGISLSDHNGYVWASQGFDWGGRGMAEHQVTDLRDLVRDIRAGATKDKYGVAIPKALREAQDLDAQLTMADDVLDRVTRLKPGDRGYPTAYEVSQLGRTTQKGKASTWFGKYFMFNNGSTSEMVLNPTEGVVLKP